MSKTTTEGYVTDVVGRVVQVGDSIVYASNTGNKVNMKVGVVKGFQVITAPFKDFRIEHHASPENPKIKVVVQYEDERSTNIFPEWTKRFVRV